MSVNLQFSNFLDVPQGVADQASDPSAESAQPDPAQRSSPNDLASSSRDVDGKRARKTPAREAARGVLDHNPHRSLQPPFQAWDKLFETIKRPLTSGPMVPAGDAIQPQGVTTLAPAFESVREGIEALDLVRASLRIADARSLELDELLGSAAFDQRAHKSPSG